MAKAKRRWFNSACHRSLYSYQTRAALALAVRYPHIAVTYLPLACTGATITDGLFGRSVRANARRQVSQHLPGTVNGQLAELRDALTAAKRRQRTDRQLDLVLLSIGANDIYFSGLVADVIVDTATERALFRRSGVIASVDGSRDRAAARDLPQGLRNPTAALKSLVGGDLAHVVYTSYANPALSDGAAPARAAAPASISIPPSMPIRSGSPLPRAATCRTNSFRGLKALALCQSGVLCREPRADRMTFVDAHQAAFADDGFCARAEADPEFDRQCFSRGARASTLTSSTPPASRCCAAAAPANTAPICRGRAGSATPMTATSRR